MVIANGLHIVPAAAVQQSCLETRASSRPAWATIRGPSRCLNRGPQLEHRRQQWPISPGRMRGPERNRLLQHPARWRIGLHLQNRNSGLCYVRRPRHRCSTSATGLPVRLSARAISRSSQRFRQAETSSTTCRSVRRISGTLRTQLRRLPAGSSTRVRSCSTRRHRRRLSRGIQTDSGPDIQVLEGATCSHPERSVLRFLAIRGPRWQRQAHLGPWGGGGLSGRPVRLARPRQGLLRPLCLQYRLFLRSRRLHQTLGRRP